MSQHAILDLGEDDLEFTENDYNQQQPSEFPNSGELDTDRLIDGGEGGENEKTFNSNFWTLGFYQQFFDVDTEDVKNRVIYSMVPIPGKSFLQHYIRPKPDLYGPIWICLTLVFSIAITGNLSDYLASATADSGPHWHYDFHKVTLAATAVFSYATLLPAGLSGFLWWMGSGAGSASLTFLELLSLYGYSLAIYVPVSILWLIQVSWLQWLLVLAGAGLSGAVLFMTVWPAVRDQAAKTAAIVMCVLLALHLLLACGFMLYFFHHDSVSGTVAPTIAPSHHNETVLAAQKSEPVLPNVEGTNAVENVTEQKKAADVDKEVKDDEKVVPKDENTKVEDGGNDSDKTDKKETSKEETNEESDKKVETNESDKKVEPAASSNDNEKEKEEPTKS